MSNFQGFIRDVTYNACLTGELPIYSFENFDINVVNSVGKIRFSQGEFAYSKWISPKRTRSYPFERLYNIINAPMRLTVIPILKDEGLDGDLDRIQYSTISWMNLLNIYIVLAFYDKAVKNNHPTQISKNKITNQLFNTALVNEQLLKISCYKQSALHWNRSLIENSFTDIYHKALDSYTTISQKTQVKVHNRDSQMRYLELLMYDFNQFKDISLRGSKNAAYRELETSHALEYLSDDSKAIFEINNYLGGTYYLTADAVIQDKEKDEYIIQKSKNASMGFLPSLADIKDGLFKLILYSNLDSLYLKNKPILFKSCLKLTGKKINGLLSMPCAENELLSFLQLNKGFYSKKQEKILFQLREETIHNPKLYIQLASNQP